MDYLSVFLKMVRYFKATIMMDIFVVTAWKSTKMVIFILVILKMELKEGMGSITPLELNKFTKVTYFLILKGLGKMIYLMDKATITIMKQLTKDSFQMA